MALCDRLKREREEKGWTQVYVAKLLKMSSSQVLSNYERGERDPDTETLSKLATLYGVTVDYLLGRTDIRTSPDPDEPTPQEIEDIIRKADIQFDGAPLDEEDKEDIIEFIKIALRQIKKRKREQI